MMIEGPVKDIEGDRNLPKIEPIPGVPPIEPTEKKDVDHSTENPNETPKNIHPYLGHNIDIKA